ncbi:hypothetical protein B0H13DRAFT_2343787 [Mycena leptocephala]|nr:hypothetical protein B0H13DRAFT_2343787 [Mycena leptocephala]
MAPHPRCTMVSAACSATSGDTQAGVWSPDSAAATCHPPYYARCLRVSCRRSLSMQPPPFRSFRITANSAATTLRTATPAEASTCLLSRSVPPPNHHPSSIAVQTLSTPGHHPVCPHALPADSVHFLLLYTRLDAPSPLIM